MNIDQRKQFPNDGFGEDMAALGAALAGEIEWCRLCEATSFKINGIEHIGLFLGHSADDHEDAAR